MIMEWKVFVSPIFYDHNMTKPTSQLLGQGHLVHKLLSELRFYIPPTQNRLFRRRSSKPISWLSTEKKNKH